MKRILLGVLVGVALQGAAAHAAVAAPQVLAVVGEMKVTADDLNAAMASSPFATQIASMDEKDQAGLRGDMLRRLVAARLLALEAKRLGLDKTPEYQQDVENFRLGLLYRYYMDRVRDRIVIPPDTLTAMKHQFKGDADGLAAAKAAYVAERFRGLKLATLQTLLQQDDTKLYEDRIKDGIKPDTVLMQGKSIEIRYGDIVDAKEHPTLPNPEWVKEQLYKRGELLLAARAADKQGVNVSAKLKQYEVERLPAVMVETKSAEWVPDEKTMRAWLEQHPDVAKIPERRHLGQLVVATRKEAEELRGRILKGESLFTLAGQYSIDPAGRKQNGDMGWVVEGSGMPELENAIAKLEDGKVSDVVETKMGFNLLTVLERETGGQKDFEDVRDRVRQMMINQQLPSYLGELERRYGVTWKVLNGRNERAQN